MTTPTTGTTRILVLGATGMLGHTVLRYFARQPAVTVAGSARSAASARLLPAEVRDLVHTGIDVENMDSLTDVLARVRPDVVINCVGLVKQLSNADDPLVALPLNALFPHRLARLAGVAGARVVHISTDCVFSGATGNYAESDYSDAKDLYGRSKYLGELDYPHAITLRTSIIGHELGGAHGLVEWFLSQQSGIRGFSRAIFSGVPTIELARIIHERVLPNPGLHGVYHVAAEPINKLDLLILVAEAYGHTIPITPDPSFQIDRSLNGERFREATGHVAPPWPEMIRRMREFH